MEISDFNELVKSRERVILELGCGPDKLDGAIGIDFIALEGVDIVANLEDGLPFVGENSVDEIHSRHVLEHLEGFEKLMAEIHRVLKPGGFKYVVVPHFSNPYYYSDYTHKRFFGLYSFDYLADDSSKLRRKVPSFYSPLKFRVLERKLVFSSPTFPLRHFIKKRIFQPIFNLSPWWQELYEEMFCYLFPCQEIHFKIEPLK